MGGVRRIFELDGDDPVDLQFFDCLQIGLEFDDTAARGEVTMDLAVAIADVDMDGSAFGLSEVDRASIC